MVQRACKDPSQATKGGIQARSSPWTTRAGIRDAFFEASPHSGIWAAGGASGTVDGTAAARPQPRSDQAHALRGLTGGCDGPQSALLRVPPVVPKVGAEPPGPIANRTTELQLVERSVVVHRACKDPSQVVKREGFSKDGKRGSCRRHPPSLVGRKIKVHFADRRKGWWGAR